MKNVLIFGSTGSIGKNTLEVIRQDKHNFKVIGLCVNRDITTLLRQIKEFSPLYVCVTDQKAGLKLQKLTGKKIKVFIGEDGLKEFAEINSDISLMAIPGIASLRSVLINIEHTKRVALANKESIVVGGKFVFEKAMKFNTEIFPVDSEINAIFQLLKEEKNSFKKVYLTASGGSLINHTKKDLKNVRIKDVLSHPTWRMGEKITVDSATLVNKGFEVVETHHFFNIPYEKIDIVLHKESTVHALVSFEDNTFFSCLYYPDMKIPIAFALYYPGRRKLDYNYDFRNPFSLSFEPIPYGKYPLLSIILKAAKKGDNSLAVLNACDEVAIDYFLKGNIKFLDLTKVMEFIFNDYPSRKIKSIDDIYYWDNWGREKTKCFITERC